MNSKTRNILIVGLAFVVGMFFVGMTAENIEPTKESKHQVESEDTANTVESEHLTIEEIYANVGLGMNQGEVYAIAGEPDVVSTSEIEGLGTMKDLIYHGSIMDNVSVLLEDDKVRMVILGTMNDDGDLDTKTKM